MSVRISACSPRGDNPQARKTSTIEVQPLKFVQRKKREKNAGTYIHEQTPLEGTFRRPRLAELGVDVARSFADHTMGVRGTAVQRRGFRWCSGADGGVSGAYCNRHSREESFEHHHHDLTV